MSKAACLALALTVTILLASATGIRAQNFGNDVGRWTEWWQMSYNRPRPTWLLDGLRHADPNLRRIANMELQALTGRTANFDPEAAEEEREASVQLWETWWQQVTKQQGAQAAPPG